MDKILLYQSFSKKIAKIAVIVGTLALIGIFVPSIIGLEGFNGGFAVSTICFFIFLSAVVTAVIFWQMAKQEAKIVKGENLLVHWRYSEEEWKDFTKNEYKIDRGYKIMLLKIIIFFAFLFGIGFWIYDHENGIYVFYTMLGLIALITAVAYYSIYAACRRKLTHHGEVYISTDGVIINGQFHSWKIFGARLENVVYNIKTKPKYLEFEYSTIARYGRQSNYVRVPVPKNEEKNAPKIIGQIKKYI